MARQQNSPYFYIITWKKKRCGCMAGNRSRFPKPYMTGSPLFRSKFFLFPLSSFLFPLSSFLFPFSSFLFPFSPVLFPLSSFLHFPDLSRKDRSDSASRVDCWSLRVLKILTGGQPEKSSVSQNMVSPSEPSVNQTLNLRSIKRFRIAWLLLINITIVYITWFFRFVKFTAKTRPLVS